jgi:hypothetical protein
MEGTVSLRELNLTRNGNVAFSFARQSDDPEIRRLLRENSTAGRISLSFEREPDYFAEPPASSETKQTIVARAGNKVVCVGSCSIRPRFVNGELRLVGYLGGLRLDSDHAGRFDILRRGYDCFHRLQQENPAAFYFTSIAADNLRARKFLERSVRGMPRYEFVGEFVTLMIPTRPARRAPGHRTKPRTVFPEEFLPFLNDSNRRHQFAPSWSASDLRRLTEAQEQDSAIHIFRDGERTRACGAVWDQRAFKQVVVRDYARSLQLMRPLLNALGRLAGTPRLPAIGEGLANAFASHLAASTSESLVELMGELIRQAAGRGLEFLTAGFAANDPRLAALTNHIRARDYRSRIYVVTWPEIGASASELDNRVLAPEVALL